MSNTGSRDRNKGQEQVMCNCRVALKARHQITEKQFNQWEIHWCVLWRFGSRARPAYCVATIHVVHHKTTERADGGNREKAQTVSRWPAKSRSGRQSSPCTFRHRHGRPFYDPCHPGHRSFYPTIDGQKIETSDSYPSPMAVAPPRSWSFLPHRQSLEPRSH